MRDEWGQSLAEWRGWIADKPMLLRMYEARIFSVGLLKNGRIGIVEECDIYFGDEMSPSELRQLADELRSVADEFDTREQS